MRKLILAGALLVVALACGASVGKGPIDAKPADAHINLWHTYHSHLINCYGDQGVYEEWGPFGRTGRYVWAGC